MKYWREDLEMQGTAHMISIHLHSWYSCYRNRSTSIPHLIFAFEVELPEMSDSECKLQIIPRSSEALKCHSEHCVVRGDCFVLLQTSRLSATRHQGWRAAVWHLAGSWLSWMWLQILISYLWAVMVTVEFWYLKQKRLSVTNLCTRWKNAISLVSNKSAAVVLRMLRLCTLLN